MTAFEINNIISEVSAVAPLIHCITNPISINQCANAILALGGRPIMAEHPSEVAEITRTANALLINLGNITDSRLSSIPISLAEANERGIPVVIDMVGIACSALRRDFAIDLLGKYKFALIKGNYSELLALYNSSYRSSGVDSDPEISEDRLRGLVPALARRYGCAILASGKRDIISDGDALLCINNGTPALSSVTGTGCMLGAICALFLSVSEARMAAASAAAVLGICGEIADKGQGSASFMTALLDGLSLIKNDDIEKLLKQEVIYDE